MLFPYCFGTSPGLGGIPAAGSRRALPQQIGYSPQSGYHHCDPAPILFDLTNDPGHIRKRLRAADGRSPKFDYQHGFGHAFLLGNKKARRFR
jgi:hypothetical protein